MQGPPAETTGRIVTAHQWVERLGRTMGDSIWPGFRPDTMPVAYVVPGQGTLLLSWRGELPQGFLPIAGLAGGGWRSSADRGAASTGTELADFEQLAELNEGLAEYTLVRVVALAARQRDFPDRTGAARLQTGKLTGLHKLTEDVKLSIRLRYYATGPALGLLLDALEGPS